MTSETAAREPLEVVLITGYSGAGRSTAARVLEDLGFYVVDNLPPKLIPEVLQLATHARSGIDRIAIVTDVRSRGFFSSISEVLTAIEDEGIRPTVVFLEAAEEVLVRRFENVRRAHPLQGEGRIIDGIQAERRVLEPVRGSAHLAIDTTGLSVHDLRRKLETAFDRQLSDALLVTVLSFGFKYGLPLDADLVFDVRFLPNPHWVPQLRAQTGRDVDVASFVLAQDGALDALDQLEALVRTMGPGYRREGKRYMTIAIGCTGGKHRSVAMTEAFAQRLASPDFDVRAVHRDLGKE